MIVSHLQQTDPTIAGAGPLIKGSDICSPMTGGELKADEKLRSCRVEVTLLCFACADFTVADDISAIAPIVVSIANRFAECGNPYFRTRSLAVTRPRDARSRGW